MDDRPSGRWRWFDAVIVAAVLVGGLTLAVATDRERRTLDRAVADESPFTPPPWKRLPSWVRALWKPANRLIADFKVFLAVASAGLPLITIRRGRLRGPGGWPGPGASATIAGATSLLVFAIGSGLEWWSMPVRRRRRTPFSLHQLFRDVDPGVSGAILGAWVVLAVAGRWKPRRDWPDRLGRWVGCGWMALMLFDGLIWSFLWG